MDDSESTDGPATGDGHRLLAILLVLAVLFVVVVGGIGYVVST
jgi:hypothetical protein